MCDCAAVLLCYCAAGAGYNVHVPVRIACPCSALTCVPCLHEQGTYIADSSNRRGPKFGPYAIAITCSSDSSATGHATGASASAVSTGTAPATIKIANVTFGDVYICAGDDAATVSDLPKADQATWLTEAASNFSGVRLFRVPAPSPTSGSSSGGEGSGASGTGWHSAADAPSLLAFSSLCYASGRALRKLYNPTGMPPSNASVAAEACPVGLIMAMDASAPLIAWVPPTIGSAGTAGTASRPATSPCISMAVEGTTQGRAFTVQIRPLQHLAIRGLFWSHGATDAAAAARAGSAGITRLSGQWHCPAFLERDLSLT